MTKGDRPIIIDLQKTSRGWKLRPKSNPIGTRQKGERAADAEELKVFSEERNKTNQKRFKNSLSKIQASFFGLQGDYFKLFTKRGTHNIARSEEYLGSKFQILEPSFIFGF